MQKGPPDGGFTMASHGGTWVETSLHTVIGDDAACGWHYRATRSPDVELSPLTFCLTFFAAERKLRKIIQN